MIFDCHCHIETGLEAYDLASVYKRNIIFNQVDHYDTFLKQVPAGDAISLIFDYKQNYDRVKHAAESGVIQAYKIHSREQKLTPDDFPALADALEKVNSNIPIIFDAFYFDHHLLYQPYLPGIILLAERFPDKTFIVAHAGGIEILRYFFHLRTLPNIIYDLSFSLQYLEDSSLYLDLIKLIKYTDKSKIMFGTDYFYASPKFQLEVMMRIMDKLSLDQKDQDAILFKNAERVFFNNQV